MCRNSCGNNNCTWSYTYNLQVLQTKESQGSIEKEEQLKGACGICNWARPRSVLENNQSTNPNERDESKSSGRKLGETVGPSKSTKKQPDLACKRSPDAPLPKLLLRLATKEHDENMDNDNDQWNKPSKDDQTDSTKFSQFGFAESEPTGVFEENFLQPAMTNGSQNFNGKNIYYLSYFSICN